MDFIDQLNALAVKVPKLCDMLQTEEATNKMDEKPFLEVDMLDLNESVVSELKKLTKPAFNLDELKTTAGDLKYTREIKKLLAEQLESPSDDFVKFCASRVFNRNLTPK